MIIGKWYKVTQVTADGDKHNKVKTYGKCIWIHPETDLACLNLMVESGNAFHRLNWG